jgi:putative membrane protein
VLLLVHTVAMWLWHAPVPYAFALSSDLAYLAMEASLLVSAFLLWQAMLAGSTHPGRALAALLGSIVQMGMLGALFTFATRPLYEAHMTTTLPFGLTPLADQQLAGIILWVPAAIPYLVAAMVIALRLLGPATRNEAA